MYKKLSKEERYQIEILFEKEHLSMHKIANLMSRNVSTISRELARNKTNNYTYNAEHAQYLANKRTWHNHCMYLEKYNEFKNIF